MQSLLFFLTWISDCNAVQLIWQFAGCCCIYCIYVDWKWNRKYSKKKKSVNFLAILRPVFKFLYHNREQGCLFFLLPTGPCLADASKCITLFAITCYHCVMFSWHWVMGTPRAGLGHSVGQSRCHDGAGQGALQAVLHCMWPAGWMCLF